MSANTGNAPAWLFSFLDLAFLILIALLHTGDRDPDPAPNLASIELPEIERANTDPLRDASEIRWQVRVHPRLVREDAAAFSLVSGEAGETLDEVRIASPALGLALAELRDRSGAKPLLAPHRDSRAEDFLTALALVQQTWPETHVAAVRPIEPLPAVSAAKRATPAGLP